MTGLAEVAFGEPSPVYCGDVKRIAADLRGRVESKPSSSGCTEETNAQKKQRRLSIDHQSRGRRGSLRGSAGVVHGFGAEENVGVKVEHTSHRSAFVNGSKMWLEGELRKQGSAGVPFWG